MVHLVILIWQPDILDDGWMFLRVNIWEKSGIPIARTDGLTVYAPESQKSLLDELTLDHYQDLSGGGFLISTRNDKVLVVRALNLINKIYVNF